VATAKLNGVEPLAWLTDVLERTVSGRTKAIELERLLPWNWQAERLAVVVSKRMPRARRPTAGSARGTEEGDERRNKTARTVLTRVEAPDGRSRCSGSGMLIGAIDTASGHPAGAARVGRFRDAGPWTS
jgi:hypothetical protein